MIPDNAVTSAIVESYTSEIATAILDALADADDWTAPAVLSALAPVSRIDHLVTNAVLKGVHRARGETRAEDLTPADIDGK